MQTVTFQMKIMKNSHKQNNDGSKMSADVLIYYTKSSLQKIIFFAKTNSIDLQ